MARLGRVFGISSCLRNGAALSWTTGLLNVGPEGGKSKVMCKITWLASLLLLPVSLSHAQKSADVLVITGRGWEALTETAKLFYVQGIKDGILIAATYLDGEERERILGTTQAKGFFPGDYMKELDTLYRDRENLLIPVSIAYQYINLKLKGTATKDELERKLVELRKRMGATY